MSARRRDTILLLSSIDPDGSSWYDPSIETTTGNIVRRSGVPGEGPTHRVDCRGCGGSGLRRVRGFESVCPEPPLGCGGSGYEDLDDYTGRRIGDSSTHLETGVKVIPCDSCGGERYFRNGEPCPRCRASGTITLTESQWRSVRARLSLVAEPIELRGGDPVSAAIDKRDAIGSYWELQLAMSALRGDHPRAWLALVGHYIYGVVASNGNRLAHDVGLAYVVCLMPDPIRVPPAVRAVERRTRYQERVLKRRSRDAA